MLVKIYYSPTQNPLTASHGILAKPSNPYHNFLLKVPDDLAPVYLALQSHHGCGHSGAATLTSFPQRIKLYPGLEPFHMLFFALKQFSNWSITSSNSPSVTAHPLSPPH